jgi:hypothetical protein
MMINYTCNWLYDGIGGVKVSMLASRAVDRGFELRLGLTRL